MGKLQAEDDPSVDDAQASIVRDHLAEIEESGAMGSTTRVGKLFHFLVEEGLAGRGHRLNAYTVGVDGLGRPESFDPSSDSSLRVAMHTIRFTLSTYYGARPDSPVVITIPRGSYIPQFTFPVEDDDRNGADERMDANDASEAGFLQKHWRMLVFFLSIAILAGGLVLWTRQTQQIARCNEARPTLSMAMSEDSGETKLRASVEEYLGYYPILTMLAAKQPPPCTGVPHFVLTITRLTKGTNPVKGNGSDYQLRLTDPAAKETVWSKTYMATENPYYPAEEAMAARMAYDIGHGTGVIASNALSHRWGRTKAAADFECLIKTHRYFDTGSTADLPPAYQCAGSRWQTSRHADLVALFSALEFDLIDMGGMTSAEKERHTKAMLDSLARAESLSANDKEVLVMKLRFARTSKPMDMGMLTAAMGAIDKYLPMEPHAINQVAVTNSAFLGNLDEGYQYTLRASLLSGGDPNIFYGAAVYFLARKDWDRLEDFAARQSSWELVNEQILALCVARKTNKPAIEERARNILARNGLRTEAQIRDAIKDNFPPGRVSTVIRECLS